MTEEFQRRNKENIEKMSKDQSLQDISREWFIQSSRYEYSYHFSWMGRPIIQFPQDMIASQEIIWKIKPDLIVETGIAHGGSLIFYASLLELIGNNGQVLGIDIDIRDHNKKEIEAHPMFKRITMLQGSSIAPEIVAQVFEFARDKKNILVVLDSNHTHDHVLKELELYSPLVRKGGYLFAFDTIVEDMPDDFSNDRPWGKGDNPKTAVWEFLKSNKRFEIDQELENKLLISVSPSGYLRCIAD